MRSITSLKALAIVASFVSAHLAFGQEAEAAGPGCSRTNIKVVPSQAGTSVTPEYSGSLGSVFAPPGANVILHYDCEDGKGSAMSSSTAGVSKGTITPSNASEQTIVLPGGQKMVLRNKGNSFEGVDFTYTVPLGAPVGSSIPLAFSEGNGLTITVSDSYIRGRQYRADWQNQNNRDAGQDDAIRRAGSGGGNFQVQLGIGPALQTDGATTNINPSFQLGYHFGNWNSTGFMLGVRYDYFGGMLENRGVVGIKTTEPHAWQSKNDFSLMGYADIVAIPGLLRIPLGLGIGLRNTYVPDSTIGNDPVSQRQFFDPETSRWAAVVKLHASLDFHLTPGFLMGPGVMFSIPTAKDSLTHGGDPVHLNVDVTPTLLFTWIPGAKDTSSSSYAPPPPPDSNGPQQGGW